MFLCFHKEMFFGTNYQQSQTHFRIIAFLQLHIVEVCGAHMRGLLLGNKLNSVMRTKWHTLWHLL